MPKLSVIIPVYNGEKYLAAAVESILTQTFSDFELIIINDGSTDQTAHLLATYADPRIMLINQPNQGVTKSLNRGLAMARGNYIARMDADDIAKPDRFAKQLALLETQPEIAFCGSWAKAIDKDGNEIADFNYPPISHEQIRRYYWFHNPFIHSSVMFRKNIIDQCGVYDEKIIRAQDYEYWGRIIRRFKTANLPEQLLLYRVLDEGITKSKNLSMRMTGLKIRWRYLVNYFFTK
jgi:glycosyltransferase involved in cell wall biosynthesis